MTLSWVSAGEVRQRVKIWARGPTSGFQALPPHASWDRRLERILPIVFAISTGFHVTKYIVTPQWIGFDASLYVDATRAWLAGGDPWSVASFGIPFGAPPPTMLLYVPFTILPNAVVAAAWVVGSFGLALLAIRALGRPWWWISFWPIVDGCLVGNPDIAVLAALVMVGGRLGFVSPIMKIYAFLPLLAERRWRTISLAGSILVASVAILPWSLWFDSLPAISRSLAKYADTSSVAGNIPLMVVGAVALASMGLRRAGWLVVPVLWPWTQPHYLAMSVPALTPTLAIAWSFPGLPPSVMLGGLVVTAIGARLAPRAEPAIECDLAAEQPPGPDKSERPAPAPAGSPATEMERS